MLGRNRWGKLTIYIHDEEKRRRRNKNNDNAKTLQLTCTCKNKGKKHRILPYIAIKNRVQKTCDFPNWFALFKLRRDRIRCFFSRSVKKNYLPDWHLLQLVKLWEQEYLACYHLPDWEIERKTYFVSGLTDPKLKWRQLFMKI